MLILHHNCTVSVLDIVSKASFQSAEIVVNYSQNTQRIPLII